MQSVLPNELHTAFNMFGSDPSAALGMTHVDALLSHGGPFPQLFGRQYSPVLFRTAASPHFRAKGYFTVSNLPMP